MSHFHKSYTPIYYIFSVSYYSQMPLTKVLSLPVHWRPVALQADPQPRMKVSVEAVYIICDNIAVGLNIWQDLGVKNPSLLCNIPFNIFSGFYNFRHQCDTLWILLKMVTHMPYISLALFFGMALLAKLNQNFKFLFLSILSCITAMEWLFYFMVWPIHITE